MSTVPIPSGLPIDFKENVQRFDEVMTSDAHYYTDRFGVKRWTIAGFEYTAKQAIAAYGYITLKSFQLGAPLPNNELTLPNQVLQDETNGEYYRWDGEFPKAVVAGSTPATTGGVGAGAWLSVGEATLRPLVEVTANVVGSNNYSAFPGVGGTITSGSDYLYNGILYTTVGDSGVVQSVTGNVVTTDTGTAYLLDKRWPTNDVRAWGVQDGVLADSEFTNAVMYFARKGGGTRSVYVPPMALYLDSVTFTDLSTFNIHFDGTYIIGTSTTPKGSIIKIYNALNSSITGTYFSETVPAALGKYTYAMELSAGLPSLIAPLSGLMHNVSIQDFRPLRFPCGIRVGDGSDLQISEINIGMHTSKCNCSIEVIGSQTIVSTTGQALCEPQPEFTYQPCTFNVIGGMHYHNGGETLSSVSDNPIMRLSSVPSALSGNPFGSSKITGAHVEANTLLLVQQGSGIVGATDSTYSTASFSNCQGSMLNGGLELVVQSVDDYKGTFSVDSTCNFYTSATRTKKIVYSTSPDFNFEVSPRAFRKGFGVLASEIGSGTVNWVHQNQPIMKMLVNVIGVSAGGTSPLGFSSRESTGDYAYYYGDTSSGGMVLAHKLDSMNISISIPANDALSIIVKVGGVEVFGCQNSGSVTLTREMIPVGSVITFEAKNGTSGTVTTASSARIIVSGSNKD